jgi:hypothetical protein
VFAKSLRNTRGGHTKGEVTFETPEEAARAGTPAEYVRVVGVVVRGDVAVVAQVMNADGYPVAYEIETATCYRERGGWVCGSSGNGDVASIPTGGDCATVVYWCEAPSGAVAGRFRLADQERVVPVEDGFAFAVFDEIRAGSDGWSFDWPALAEWLWSDDARST